MGLDNSAVGSRTELSQRSSAVDLPAKASA